MLGYHKRIGEQIVEKGEKRMPNPSIDFEDFLKSEANRYFKAPPQTSLDHDGAVSPEPTHQKVSYNAWDEAYISSPEVITDRPKATTPRIDADQRWFADLGSEGRTRINPPAETIDRDQFGIDPGSSNRAVATIGDGYIKDPGIGLLNDPRRFKLPFQERYEQPIIDLSTSLTSLSTFTHGAQFPIDHVDAAYYFLSESLSPVSNNHSFPASVGSSAMLKASALDVEAIRADFPILRELVNGHPLIWLDNAATTQKPQVVIDRLAYFYTHENSNIHRAAHELAARATDAYEDARHTVKDFLHASTVNEIVFTRGTTEAVNLVASSWGEKNLGADDEIILSVLEHHANIVPWQLLSQRKGFKIRVIPVDDAGNLLLEEYAKLLSHKTKLVAFTHVSNALGTVTPAKQIIDLAHQAGAKVLLDGAQSVSHMRIDLQYLNPDFFVFSGHKVFGPTGIGVLYGKEELLNQMAPYQGGGNMIKDVRFDHTSYHDAPTRFEAGTGNIADAVGLASALRYVQGIGLDHIAAYEHHLLAYATHLLKEIPGVTRIGTAHEKASVLSFTVNGLTNDAVGAALNEVGIAVRTGHHCAQPILRRLGYESTVRPSLAFYNTCAEIDFLIHNLEKIIWRQKRY